MNTEKEGKLALNQPSQVDTSVDLFHHWQPETTQPLEFNSYFPELFQVLNRKKTAFYEVINPLPELAPGVNDFRSEKSLTPEQASWAEVINEIEESDFAVSFESGNRIGD